MGHLGGTASVEIDASIEDVWEVVQDVLIAPEWQGGLDKMTALEHDAEGRPTLVETENDIKVRRVKSRVRFRYAGPTLLAWTQEQGHTLDADPGRVLGLVIRGPVQAATQAIFVNGRPGELKRRVEGRS